MGILSFIVLRCDYFLLERMLPSKNLGCYSLAANLAENLCILGPIISSLMLPKFSTLSKVKEMYIKTFNVVKYTIFIFAAILIAGIIFSKYFLVLLFGSEYAESKFPFLILLLSNMLLSLQSILAQFFNRINKLRFLLIHWLIASAINIISNYILIPIKGINGAAFASLLSYSYIFIVVFYFFYLHKYKLDDTD
jgi:O-antigen/teichoic acid export membrane protein